MKQLPRVRFRSRYYIHRSHAVALKKPARPKMPKICICSWLRVCHSKQNMRVRKSDRAHAPCLVEMMPSCLIRSGPFGLIARALASMQRRLGLNGSTQSPSEGSLGRCGAAASLCGTTWAGSSSSVSENSSSNPGQGGHVCASVRMRAYVQCNEQGGAEIERCGVAGSLRGTTWAGSSSSSSSENSSSKPGQGRCMCALVRKHACIDHIEKGGKRAKAEDPSCPSFA